MEMEFGSLDGEDDVEQNDIGVAEISEILATQIACSFGTNLVEYTEIHYSVPILNIFPYANVYLVDR